MRLRLVDKSPRRSLAAIVAAPVLAAMVLAAPVAARAADVYPTHIVRLVVPFPPGGTTDVLARLVAQHLAESLGQPFVVENRPGAGGTIGADVVAKAEPDGYTLVLAPPGPFAINLSLYKQMPYDTATAFAPISLIAQAPNVLVVQPKHGFTSVRDLIAYAKATPGKVDYASQGTGSTSHLTGALFASAAGIDIVHVPYKGSGPAMTDLLGGQVDMMFDALGNVTQNVQSGALQALAVTGAARTPLLADVPTMIEAGLPGFVSVTWWAMAAPAATPQEVIAVLNHGIVGFIRKPDMVSRLAALGVEPVGGTPRDMTRFVQEETARWGGVVKIAGIRPE